MMANRRVSRREVLAWMGGMAFGSRLCGAPAMRSSQPRTRLGIVIYTLGMLRRRMKAERTEEDLFSPDVFLDYCYQLGAGGIQVPLGVLEAEACRQLRKKVEARSMFIEGIASPPFGKADTDRFEAEIRTAALVGVKAVRTVIIPGRRYERFKSLDEYRQFAERGRRALEIAAPIVERHRVRLAVENHKDQRLQEREALFRRLDCSLIGACVDTGNSFALLEDPLLVVQTLAPYAHSVHLKDQAIREYEDGFLLADVALGDGFLDLPKMVDILRSARPEVEFSLETITRDPLKVPCLTDGYWSTFPDVRGRDLARTLRVVRGRSSQSLQQVSSLSSPAQEELEQVTVRKSLEYARDHLGL